jgi:hypothetical protein
VTLGDRATPEGLDANLAQLGAQFRAFAAFRPEEVQAARLARLEDLIGRINGLAAQGRSDEIWDLTEMVPDHDIDVDLAWMTADRQRRGEPLPPELA